MEPLGRKEIHSIEKHCDDFAGDGQALKQSEIKSHCFKSKMPKNSGYLLNQSSVYRG